MLLFAITLTEVLECLIPESEGFEKCSRYQEVVYVRTDNSSRPTHVNEIVQVMVKDFISINVTVDYMMCIQYLRSIKTREHMNKVLINGGIQNF